DMSFEEFISLSEPVFLSSMLQLYGWGEPFMNPEYEKMFNYVVDNFDGLKFYISTNGSLLNDTWIDKLVKYNNSVINISLNAATAATYASIMKRDKFVQVMNNIKKLDEARKKIKDCRTRIFLSFVNTSKNIEELPQFVELASDINAGVIIQDLNVMEQRHEELIVQPEKARSIFKRAQKKAMEKKVQFCSFSSLPLDYLNIADMGSGSIPDDILLLPPGPGQCYEPWQRMLMGADGTISPCCNSQMNMGNMHEKRFQDIWNGNMYVYLRQTVNTPYPPEDCLKCPVKTGY
ncbi:MAG TPA: radical SAM protein, partial [Candidatus Methanoperedens sp.]